MPRQINPNLKYLTRCYTQQKYKGDKLIKGKRGVILEGGSRGGKTYSSVDFIILLCVRFEKKCKINIYREFFADFRDTLYDDFKRRLDVFGLENPFHNAQIVKSFKILGSTVSFLGCDKIGSKHGAGSDYVFYNEMIHIPQAIFDQSEMRCRKFWWGDYNPSATQHWIFDKVLNRNDVGYKHTTLLDNPYITPQEKNKITASEPWEAGSYDIIEGQIFYKGKLVDEKHQPPPNLHNIEQGTADEYTWIVYGLGLRGAMKGQIFKLVTWIDKFPDIAFTYGQDFGFTSNPSALVKYSREGKNIYLEPMAYAPTETAEELDATYKAIGVSKFVPITADSSDKYVSEKKGSVQMVGELFDMGWEISKVSKTKGVMYWITNMKGYKIHIVKNHLYEKIKKEQENYIFKEVNGILINMPVDKFNHFWDGSRYSHMSWEIDNLTADIS